MCSVHLKVDSIEPSISHACEIQQTLIDACTLCSYNSSRLSELKNFIVRASKAVLMQRVNQLSGTKLVLKIESESKCCLIECFVYQSLYRLKY